MKNLNKHISFVILLCLGVLLIPSIHYVCAKKTIKTEQKYCSKDQSAKAEQKDCCKTKSCKKDKDHNNCNGKCKHSSCKWNSPSSSLSLPIPIDLKATNSLIEIKKQKFGFKQAHYSSGYSSIWKPPKIGYTMAC